MDPVKEWQRLSRLYSEKPEEELLELAVGFTGLTEIAQDTLRTELKNRGLGDPETAAIASTAETPTAQPTGSEHSLEEDIPWILRESGNPQVLRELQYALEQAGIHSEIVNPQENIYRSNLPQLQVAGPDAERAEQCSRSLGTGHSQTRKLPQKSLTSRPACAACGTPDPLLEGVVPFNTWLCEVCGARWTESANDPSDSK